MTSDKTPHDALREAAQRFVDGFFSSNRRLEEHYEAISAALAAVGASPAQEVWTDERIDRIADLVVKGMPDGINGFLKTWGWQQFARALIADCGLVDAPVAVPQEAQQLEQHDLEQSADYATGYEDGRLKGYDVGYRHAQERAAPTPAPVAQQLTESEMAVVLEQCGRGAMSALIFAEAIERAFCEKNGIGLAQGKSSH